MDKKVIALAADHAGFETKEIVRNYLIEKGIEYKDFGCYSEESVDYPDFGHQIGKAINDGDYELGFAVCGSGQGINITVNKHENVRSALCWNVEIAKLAKQHNNANICAIPGRFISKEEAITIAEAFLNTAFEGGRHQRRVDKIPIKKDN